MGAPEVLACLEIARGDALNTVACLEIARGDALKVLACLEIRRRDALKAVACLKKKIIPFTFSATSLAIVRFRVVDHNRRAPRRRRQSEENMVKNRSIDDLRTAHRYLTRSAEAQLWEMPEYIRAEKAALDAIYAELETVSKARTCVGVQKTTDLAQRTVWTERATATLARTKLFLRARAPETVREYFPEAVGSASRKIDRLHVVIKVLTVSEHFGHAHLGEFEAELEALRAEGEVIFGAASVSVTEQKTEVERLNGLKARWESQYQKLKLLFRGYFYGTATDCAKFFDEKRLARTAQDKDGDNGVTAASEPSALPS
jgi:hypothetical protein